MMPVGEKGNLILDDATYGTLHSLLNSAATSTGGARACLITDSLSGPLLLATSDEPGPPRDTAYEPCQNHAALDVVHQGSVIARLVVDSPREAVGQDQLAPFSVAA